MNKKNGGGNVKKISKLSLLLLIIVMAFTAVGCSTSSGNQEGQDIIEAKEALSLLNEDNVKLVDAQNFDSYSTKHVEGAVNISRDEIVVNEPVPNLLAPQKQLEDALGKKGVSNDSIVIIYDNNNNMDAARLWWTLRVYGHENVKVVSGGINALTEAGATITSAAPNVTPVQYTAKERNDNMIATKSDVLAQINNPDSKVVLLDTRSQEEYDQGTIPSSILIDYLDNNYNDGTYRKIQDIKIIYKEAKIEPDNTVIMYCKTSIRGAETYLALYNAGYRNLKLYDGAWIEWSADDSLPIQMPSNTKIESNQQDNS